MKETELMSVENNIEILTPLSESYASCDDWYQFTTPDNFWIQWRFDALARLIDKRYVWGRVLDIGCGGGIVGWQIKDRYGCEVEGCDLSHNALKIASSNLASVYFYDIHQRLERFKEGFSTILLFDVLEHFTDPEHFLESTVYHLKRDGRLIINVPAIQFLYGKYDARAGHIKRYSLKDLEKELAVVGFYVEKYTYWGFFLVPVVFLRKIVTVFLPKNKVLRVGFQPSGRFIEYILQLLRKIECRMLTNPPIGASLMIVARRK